MVSLRFRSCKRDYLFIAPAAWDRERASHPLLSQYERLDVSRATLALHELAWREPGFLETLARDLPSLRHFGDHASLMRGLVRALGRPRALSADPPAMATLYILKRKRSALQPPSDPWKSVRDAIDAAERAPRGFVIVEAASETGVALPGIRVEILSADGQVQTRRTDSSGRVRVDPIPQGQCHIRVPDLDGSAWHPGAGAPATRVDRGPKRIHVVTKGECLSRIAKNYGIHAWKRLWNSPDNERLRAKRKNPDLLYPGDEIVIPGIEVCEIIRGTDQSHAIVITNPQVDVIVTFRDAERTPLAQASYELSYATSDGKTRKSGALDGKGTLRQRIPAYVANLLVSFPKVGSTFELAIGDLDPVEDDATKAPVISGVQARLGGLGYDCHADAAGTLGLCTRCALQEFQRVDMGCSEPSGEPDPATRAKLVELYGV